MILAPFRLVVSLLFRASYAVFHNPGWAVVGMSVLLSLLLTPLYVWIERRKNANRVSEAPMATPSGLPLALGPESLELPWLITDITMISPLQLEG